MIFFIISGPVLASDSHDSVVYTNTYDNYGLLCGMGDFGIILYRYNLSYYHKDDPYLSPLTVNSVQHLTPFR